MMSLREARDRSISTAQFSTFVERTAVKGFAPQVSDVTLTYADRSKTVLLHQRKASDEHTTLAQGPDSWHEMQPVGGSTAPV